VITRHAIRPHRFRRARRPFYASGAGQARGQRRHLDADVVGQLACRRAGHRGERGRRRGLDLPGSRQQAADLANSRVQPGAGHRRPLPDGKAPVGAARRLPQPPAQAIQIPGRRATAAGRRRRMLSGAHRPPQLPAGPARQDQAEPLQAAPYPAPQPQPPGSHQRNKHDRGEQASSEQLTSVQDNR